MTFKQKLQAAGFKTQKQFAEHCGRTEKTIGAWARNTPGEVDRLLDLRISLAELVVED